MAMRPQHLPRPRPLQHAAVRLAGAFWLVAALGGGLAARADTSFLKIEALTVDATDPNHDGWVNLLGFSTGSVVGPLVPQALGGPQASPPHFTDLTVRRYVDQSSPILMGACASGKHYPKGQIDFVRADGTSGGVTYMKITLTNVMVSSYSFSSSSGDRPMESLSLNFTKFTVDYTDRTNTGSCRVTYDVGTADSTFSAGPPQNKPPTLSPVTSKLGVSPQMIQFTVSVADAESPPAALTMTGVSDNAALLPATNITFSGAGAIRTVTLRPTQTAAGLAHVTLSVSDGSAATSVFFLVIFNPPPPAPTLNLSNTNVAEHTPAGTIIGQFTANPPLPPGTTGLTLLDSAAGRVRIQGSQLLVNDPILLDFETSPQPQIIVRMVSLASGQAYHFPFTIQVQDVLEGPFDAWRKQFFTATELLDPSIAGPEADPDRDGKKNLFEYGVCLPPKDGNDTGAPRLGEMTIAGKKYLTLIYRRRPLAFDPDLSVTPFIATDFLAWDCGPAHFVLVSATQISADCEEVIFRAVTAKQDRLRQFVRLEVVR